MLSLFVLPLVLGYGPAAVWALVTGGPTFEDAILEAMEA